MYSKYGFILQKEFTVYVNKTGTVEDLLNEAENEVHTCLPTCVPQCVQTFNYRLPLAKMVLSV